MQLDVPKPLYIFTNTLHPTTWHNLNFGGSFASAGWASAHMNIDGYAEKYLAGTVDFRRFVPNPDAEVGVISMYSKSATNDYFNEYNAELTRRAYFPLLPSRLSAIYAFGDFETCARVSEKYGWPLGSVMEFELVAVDSFTRVARVNMEIVSLMRLSTDFGMIDAETTGNVWRHYWGGGGSFSMELPVAGAKRETFESGEIWEYLIEGRVERVGGRLKGQATDS